MERGSFECDHCFCHPGPPGRYGRSDQGTGGVMASILFSRTSQIKKALEFQRSSAFFLPFRTVCGALRGTSQTFASLRQSLPPRDRSSSGLGPLAAAQPTGLCCLRSCPFGCKPLRFLHIIKESHIIWDSLFWCAQRDLNPHGRPLDPKSSASANSAMSAYTC